MGNTYPHRITIKSFGGYFLSSRKIWRLPYSEENHQRIQELCEQYGGGAFDEPVKAPLDEQTKKQLTQNTQLIDQNPKNLALSISELVQRVHQGLKKQFPSPLWVIGESQNISIKNQCVYFVLAEKNPTGISRQGTTTINAVIWSTTYQKLLKRYSKHILESILIDGLKLCVCGEVSLYQARGTLTLLIEDLDPNYTKGSLALAREQLLRKIRHEGLDKKNKQHRLPPFPFKIGLISADNSRAKNDFCHQLLTLGFFGEILFAPASMQGEHIFQEVQQAFEKLIAEQCDIIVLTRGGGSLADLRWFDTYELARIIAQCPIPVISAIGHHDDVSIAEEVSHQRFKTPTAAADFLLAIFQQTKDSIQKITFELSQILQNKQQVWSEQQQQLSLNLNHKATSIITFKQHKLVKKKLKIQEIIKDCLSYLYNKRMQDVSVLEKLCLQKLHTQRTKQKKHAHRLDLESNKKLYSFNLIAERLSQKIKSKDPRPWMKKGWTQFFKENKKIASIHDVSTKDQVTASLLDGNLVLQVSKIITHTEGKKSDEPQEGITKLSRNA